MKIYINFFYIDFLIFNLIKFRSIILVFIILQSCQKEIRTTYLDSIVSLQTCTEKWLISKKDSIDFIQSATIDTVLLKLNWDLVQIKQISGNKEMDLRNNQIGLNLFYVLNAIPNDYVSYFALLQVELISKINNGDFWIINNLDRDYQPTQFSVLVKSNLYIMKLLFFITFLILSISCNKIDKGVIFLNDIKKDTLIKIPLKSIGSPTTAILKVTGFVEDTCSLMESGLILPKGEVDTNFKYDYYNSEEYILQYYSKKSKKTSLKIEYYIP